MSKKPSAMGSLPRQNRAPSEAPVSSDNAAKPADQRVVEPVRTRSNKTLRMYDDHNAMLAEASFMQSREAKRRITESDIVAEALDMWAVKHGVDLDDYR